MTKDKGLKNLGRKRTSNKKALNLYVDKDIIEDLKKLELNPSAIFTNAAKAELERQKNIGNSTISSDKSK